MRALLSLVTSLGSLMAASTEDLWPWDKMKRRYEHATADAQGDRKLAVLVNTGAMNPVHKGHLQMLHKARDRLEQVGFVVVGAWLSPSHDGYVLPKAANLETPGLPADFRLILADLITQGDDLVAVGRWEADKQHRHWPDFPEVAESLRRALLKEHPEIQVFYVSGSDHALKLGLLRHGMGRDVGLVVVPRAGESLRQEEEKPAKRIYIAHGADGEVASFSSTKVREALEKGDRDFVEKAMSTEAARFLLSPSRPEYDRFPKIFKKLGIEEPDLTPEAATAPVAEEQESSPPQGDAPEASQA